MGALIVALLDVPQGNLIIRELYYEETSRLFY